MKAHIAEGRLGKGSEKFDQPSRRYQPGPVIKILLAWPEQAQTKEDQGHGSGPPGSLQWQ